MAAESSPPATAPSTTRRAACCLRFRPSGCIGRRPKRGQASHKYNQSASSPQANPRKSKQKGLDLVVFLWPNLDFSMGYSGKNKKISIPTKTRPGCKMWRTAPVRGHRCPCRGACGGRVCHPGDYTHSFRFAQDNVDEFRNSIGVRVALALAFSPAVKRSRRQRASSCDNPPSRDRQSLEASSPKWRVRAQRRSRE